MILTCPSCGHSMEASEALLHKQVGCPRCQRAFRAELPKATIIDDNIPVGKIAKIDQDDMPAARITPESVSPSTPDELGGSERLADLTRAVGSPKRRRPMHRRSGGTEDALMRMSGGSTAQPKPEGWYVKTSKGDVGPLNDEKLAEVTHKGLIKRDTKLKRGKKGGYITAAEVPGLFKKPPVDADRISDTGGQSLIPATSGSPQPAPKPTSQPASKPAAKPASKPTSKPTSKPASKSTSNTSSSVRKKLRSSNKTTKTEMSSDASLGFDIKKISLAVLAILIVGGIAFAVWSSSGGSSGMTVEEFKVKIEWQGVASHEKDDFYKLVGKPDKIQEVGDSIYLYYQCSDGRLQLVCNKAVYEHGDMILVTTINRW